MPPSLRGPRAPRVLKHTNWLWSSFWWAQQPPSPALFQPSQWQHFNGCAVSQPRTDAVNQDNLCFNPYLEGHQSPNGAYSNCMNCHLKATFLSGQTPLSGSVFSLHAQSVTCLNSPDHDGNPPTSCLRDSNANAPTVPTHFLWSVADMLDPGTPAAANHLPMANNRR
jgi:hypothetical protein